MWLLALLALAHAPARSGSVTPIPTAGISATPFTTQDGKKGWRVKIPGGRALATPAVAGDTVFIGGGFGSHEFYAFDAASGKPRWAIRVSDDGPTAAVVAGNRVVFNTESCTVFVVDARTGQEVWSRWLGDPLMSQPAVAAGTIFMAYPGKGGHRLIALALEDGKTRWEAPIKGDIISAPVVKGDAVYLATQDGTVYRVERESGKVVWQEAMHATSAPFVDEKGEVHVSRGEARGAQRYEALQRMRGVSGAVVGGMVAHKRAEQLEPDVQRESESAKENAKEDSSVGFAGGAPALAAPPPVVANLGQSSVKGLWEFQGSRPIVSGGKSYAMRGDALQAVGADGKVLWEGKMSGNVRAAGAQLASPPALAGGKLVVGTSAGTIEAYEAEGGKRIFSIEVGDAIRFQPALAGGRIFVGTERGTLVCVATGDSSLDGWTMWGGGPRHNGAE